MEKDELTFEEARTEGAKRLEKFVRYVFGNNVEVINTFDESKSELDEKVESLPSA